MSSPILTKYRYRRRLPHLQKADCDLFVALRAMFSEASAVAGTIANAAKTPKMMAIR